MCDWNEKTLCYVPISSNDSFNKQTRWAWKEVDSCIATIVNYLNKKGQLTRSACCGHGRTDPTIVLQNGQILTVKRKDEYNSIPDTEKHIEKVRESINKIITELKERAEGHDKSKMESPELEIFNEVTPKLKELTYGSPEYATQLEHMGEALKHHYEANSHHPEHYIDGVADMTLVDLVEMFCDWCAATHRHADGDIVQSIYHNQNRFNLGSTLSKIMLNTSAEYRMGQRKSDDK